MDVEPAPEVMASPQFYKESLDLVDKAIRKVNRMHFTRSEDELRLDKVLLEILEQTKRTLEHLSKVRMIVYLPLCIALDGRAAAGKSTIGLALSELLDLPLFHMDDFYLPPALRTEERFNTPGGNIDTERFKEAVMYPMRKGDPFSYEALIPHEWTYSEARQVGNTAMAIVEGAYTLHENLRHFYRSDLSFFIDVDPEEQMERIFRRNGIDAATMFVERWIPYEEAYIDAMRPEDYAIQTLKL